jgi:hypothetical protein
MCHISLIDHVLEQTSLRWKGNLITLPTILIYFLLPQLGGLVYHCSYLLEYNLNFLQPILFPRWLSCSRMYKYMVISYMQLSDDWWDMDSMISRHIRSFLLYIPIKIDFLPRLSLWLTVIEFSIEAILITLIIIRITYIYNLLFDWLLAYK